MSEDMKSLPGAELDGLGVDKIILQITARMSKVQLTWFCDPPKDEMTTGVSAC